MTGSTGIPHLMVPVRDEETLRSAERDTRLCPEACETVGAESLYLFAIRGDGDVVTRMFDKGQAIGEDPATGSAAGPLGAYLSIRSLAGMPGTVRVAQGESIGRPSRLDVETERSGESWAIAVGGGVQQVGEGSFEL